MELFEDLFEKQISTESRPLDKSNKTTENIHDRVHIRLWVIYHMVSTTHFKCIPSAFLVKSFFSLLKNFECLVNVAH